MSHLLTNPDLALLLLLAGILLLYAEFNRPGTVLFAALGTLLAMLALHGLAQHPIRPAVLALVIIALVLIPLAVRFPFLTWLALPVLVFALRALIPENPRIHLTTAVFFSLIYSTVTIWLGRIAQQARRNKRILNPTPHSAAPAPQGRLKL